MLASRESRKKNLTPRHMFCFRTLLAYSTAPLVLTVTELSYITVFIVCGVFDVAPYIVTYCREYNTGDIFQCCSGVSSLRHF